MTTNIDIVQLIAQFVEANPVVFTRLALVNRDFYSVFTSDQVWQRLNVYEVPHNIYADFKERLPTLEGLMRVCWTKDVFEKCFKGKCDNRYVQLGNVRFGSLYTEDSKYKSADPVFARLLHSIDPGNFSILPKNDRNNKEAILKACLVDLSEIMFVPKQIRQDVEFMCRLIDATTHLDASYGFVHQTDPIQIIDHAIKVRPRVICPSYRPSEFYRERFRHVLSTREMVLYSIRGNPPFLDFFPEYWQDREICLAALDYNTAYHLDGFHTFNAEFLRNCTDEEVIAKALQNYPDAIMCVPPKYQRDPNALKYALEHSQDYLLRRLEQEGENDNPGFKDPGVLAVCMDNGLCSAGYPCTETLDKMGKDLEWMKNRVLACPMSWHYASEELHSNKELLLLALDGQEMVKRGGPELFNRYFLLEIQYIPEHFFRDEDVVERLSELSELGSIPCELLEPETVHDEDSWDEDSWNEEPMNEEDDHMNEDNVKDGDDNDDDDDDGLDIVDEDLEPGESYSFNSVPYRYIREYIRKDVGRISCYTDLVPYFAKDPSMSGFMAVHFHDIQWETTRGFRYRYDEPDETNWNNINRQSALRIYTRHPQSFSAASNRWIDTEFVAAAVKRDGYIFGKLSKRFQDNKLVQMSIGPLAEKAPIW